MVLEFRGSRWVSPGLTPDLIRRAGKALSLFVRGDVGWGPDPLQPQLVVRTEPASREKPRGSSLHHSAMGMEGLLNLPLTSVLSSDDGWHLRDWNCTVRVWHAFPLFPGSYTGTEPLSLWGSQLTIFHNSPRPSTLNANHKHWMCSQRKAAVQLIFLFIYIRGGIILLANGSILNLQFCVNMVYQAVNTVHALS